MRAIGIDPGSITTGYGILDYVGPGRHKFVAEGSIKPPKGLALEDRIVYIAEHLEIAINEFKPQVCSIETLFHGKNVKSAITLAQVRGAIVLLTRNMGLNLFEYSPTAVKQSVAGYGRASKDQVFQMVKTLLNIKTVSSVDSSDALAIAICHLANVRFNQAVIGGTK